MRKSKLLNALSILLILAPMLAACSPSWKSITQERDQLISRLTLERTRMDKASDEVKQWSGKFPAHYTDESQTYLDSANEALKNIGEEVGWMAELNKAIETKDRKTATDRLEKIKGALEQVSGYTNRILGPPDGSSSGLYRELEQKVERLHNGFDPNDGKDLKSEVSDLISPTRTFIDNAEDFKLCGSEKVMSYTAAWNKYNAGAVSFRQAEQQQEKFILAPDGKSVVDEPAVSDWLVAAYDSLIGAMGEASGAKAAHKSAVDAIDAAESSKDWADLALMNFLADYHTTVSSEHSSGVSDLNSAYTSCWNENFTAAVTSANNAKTHFDAAVYWSTKTKPEETTSPSSNDDPIDPWSYGSGDNNETTPSTYEEPTDNPSWDYESDDDSSWGSGGSDDSSWDDAIFLSARELEKLIQPLYEWITNRR